MSSKPALHLTTTMPETTDHKRPQSALRSPRFHEDFDAPFSEALLNASTITLSTDSDRSPLSQETSDMSAKQTETQSPRPMQTREDSWSSTHSSRSTSSTNSGVNDRIREWARKSFLVRRRSDDGQSSQS